MTEISTDTQGNDIIPEFLSAITLIEWREKHAKKDKDA